jgi:hypothetical protein
VTACNEETEDGEAMQPAQRTCPFAVTCGHLFGRTMRGITTGGGGGEGLDCVYGEECRIGWRSYMWSRSVDGTRSSSQNAAQGYTKL